MNDEERVTVFSPLFARMCKPGAAGLRYYVLVYLYGGFSQELHIHIVWLKTIRPAFIA
jgi:hypothetical protein